MKNLCNICHNVRCPRRIVSWVTSWMNDSGVVVARCNEFKNLSQKKE